VKGACTLALFIEMDLFFFYNASSSLHHLMLMVYPKKTVWRANTMENKDLVANKVWFLKTIFFV